MGTKNGTRAGTATQEPKQRPAQTIRIGRLKVTIWRQESDKGPWFSTVPSRTYKDQGGNWQSSSSLGRDDLLVMAKLLDQAHTWMCRELAKEAGSGGNGQVDEEDAAQSEEIPF
jgi:hypothetical protein